VKKWETISGTEVHRILGSRCNVYLAKTGNHALLFDSSMKVEATRLARRIRNLGVTKLDAMIFSHTHFDHVGNAAFVRKEFHVQVFVQQEESAYLERGRTPLPAGTTWATAWLMRMQHKRGIPTFPYEPCIVDCTVSDRLDLSELGFNATLLATPGHSAGSMCLIIEDEIALVGDTMFGQLPGIIFPPFADSPEQIIKSWEKLLETSCKIFLPAHGRPVTRGLLEKWYKRKRLGE